MTQAEFNAWIRARFNLWTKSDVDAAIKAERESCAKEADEYATYGGSNFYDSFKKLAAIIRARGEASIEAKFKEKNS